MPTCMKIERTQVISVPGLGARIKAARLASDRPLRELANAADMTTANWYRIEKEDVQRLPEPTLRSIERVLGVDFGVSFSE